MHGKGRLSVMNSQSGALGAAAVQIGFLIERGFGWRATLDRGLFGLRWRSG